VSDSSPIPPHRIQWHEGLLLGPQHLQQESGRVDALVAWHTQLANPYAWGVRDLRIDEALLATGVLRIERLDAVMPDGMAVQHPPGAGGSFDLEIDLRAMVELFEAGDVEVFLTLGHARSLHDPQASRFAPMPGALVEDEVSDALPVDIARMRPNLALAAGRVPPSVYAHLRLATVRKHDEVFSLAASQPPLLAMGPGHPLRQRAQALAAQLRGKAAFLARQGAQPSSRLEDRLDALEARGRLEALVAQLPLLEGLLGGPVLHPHALYLGLCAQLGTMSMLRPGAVPPLPPAWDQAQPSKCLDPLLDMLESLAGEVSQAWHTRRFRLERGRFELNIAGAWLGDRLIVGLRGMAERELAAWMNGAVIGAESLWSSLGDRRILGAARQPVAEAPEFGVRAGSGYALFAIAARSGFVRPDETLVIGASGDTPGGGRPLEVVLFVRGAQPGSGQDASP
jgi:type VI secretion system protein ImpJ